MRNERKASVELRHLRYFYEVANEMNFTRAAEKLNIAQPPLSKQIKDLEEELGVQLFERRPHFLALTPEGTVFKQYAGQILELADRSKEAVREMGSGLNGTINISAVEGGSTQRMLSKWILEFSKDHPAVRFNIWTGSSDEIVTRLRDGLCDFGIGQDIRAAAGIRSVILYRQNWTAIIPKNLPVAEGEEDSLDATELLPYDLIIPLREDRLDEINSWFRNIEAGMKIKCRYANVRSAYELSRQGVGVSLYPGDASEVTDSKRDRYVVMKTIRNPKKKVAFMMLFNESRILSNVASEFAKYIRRQDFQS